MHGFGYLDRAICFQFIEERYEIYLETETPTPMNYRLSQQILILIFSISLYIPTFLTINHCIQTYYTMYRAFQLYILPTSFEAFCLKMRQRSTLSCPTKHVKLSNEAR